MIYEMALVLRTDLQESGVKTLLEIVHDCVKTYDGEILIEDDWGKLTFAQPSKSGIEKGHYIYFMFKANNENNLEIARRFRINEGVLNSMIIKLGEDEDLEKIVKTYKTPYSTKYRGSVTDVVEPEEGSEGSANAEKDRKKFARKKTCWFAAKSIKADWKDPKTYGWLVNEFGKISPARVTSISRKHQRFANNAVKRARNIGLISHLSDQTAH